ncbi:MAG: hypothetical protein J7M14_05100 [Planctomycetes bacterium]|nr:hypothetical protein [Planctomycetota bacterium]
MELRYDWPALSQQWKSLLSTIFLMASFMAFYSGVGFFFACLAKRRFRRSIF